MLIRGTLRSTQHLTLQHLTPQPLQALPSFDIRDVIRACNATKTVEQHAGGQAKVYIFHVVQL